VVRDSSPKVRELYFMPLRARLKPISVPLRPTDKDVLLDLQPLVDRCYKMGRHWLTDFTRRLPLALKPEDELWAQQLLVDAGLVTASLEAFAEA
jgi:hypothetical protein